MAQRNGGLNKYRGLGAAVAGLGTEAALQVAGMDWKTVQLPMVIQGKSEQRPSAFKSLVRSDNGEELGVSTADYKPIHNHQIVGSMLRVGEAVGNGMQLERLGALDGGRRIWGMATIPGHSFSLPVGKEWEERMRTAHGGSTSWIHEDNTQLKALFGSGHVPGMAFSIEFMAERQICTNGAKISKMLGRFYMTHSGTFDANTLAKIRSLFEGAGMVFEKYEQQARYLRSVSIGTEESRVLVAQLLGPQTLIKMVEEGRIGERVRMGWSENDKVSDGFNGLHTGRLLDAIVAQDASREVVEQMLNRPAKRVVELINTQPGAEMAKDTLWNTYNAVTYFVDHERGLNNDSGLNAALFGEGAQTKVQAMELATQYGAVLTAGAAR